MSFSDLMKKWHKKYVEDEDEKNLIHHSTSYHTYFQGYSEKKVLNADGKGYQIVRKYTGPYLSCTEDKRVWRRRKFLYVALYLSSCVLTLLALNTGASSTRSGPVAVWGVLQLVAALLMLIPMGNFLAAPMVMRMGQFNLSVKRMDRLSMPIAILALAFLLAQLVWHLVTGTTLERNEWLCACLQLFSTAAAAVFCLLEKKVKYQRIPNEAVDQSGFDANEIW